MDSHSVDIWESPFSDNDSGCSKIRCIKPKHKFIKLQEIINY